jgi:hypothetical protein
MHSKKQKSARRRVVRPRPYAALWAEYLEARARAERSADMADGIAAGKAWVRFIKQFSPLPPAQQNQQT